MTKRPVPRSINIIHNQLLCSGINRAAISSSLSFLLFRKIKNMTKRPVPRSINIIHKQLLCSGINRAAISSAVMSLVTIRFAMVLKTDSSGYLTLSVLLIRYERRFAGEVTFSFLRSSVFKEDKSGSSDLSVRSCRYWSFVVPVDELMVMSKSLI